MLNVAALNGRLTSDPELRHTGNDVPVCSFTLAVDRGYVAKGQDRQADFIDIVAWRQTAEFCAKYFKKGQLVAVEGSIQTRSYTDSQGNKRKATEIVANKVDFAESRKSAGQGSPDELRQNCKDQGVEVKEQQTVSTGSNEDFVEISGEDTLPF